MNVETLQNTGWAIVACVLGLETVAGANSCAATLFAHLNRIGYSPMYYHIRIFDGSELLMVLVLAALLMFGGLVFGARTLPQHRKGQRRTQSRL